MEALEDGDNLLLRPRVSPVVPPLGAVASDWGAIGSLGVLDSLLCKFPILQEVPEQHKGAWAATRGEVLARWDGRRLSRRPTGHSCGWDFSPRPC